MYFQPYQVMLVCYWLLWLFVLKLDLVLFEIGFICKGSAFTCAFVCVHVYTLVCIIHLMSIWIQISQDTVVLELSTRMAVQSSPVWVLSVPIMCQSIE